MCTCRKLVCDMFVAYVTHAKPCIHKDMPVLAYTRVYRHVHAISTITRTCVVTAFKRLYNKLISKV